MEEDDVPLPKSHCGSNQHAQGEKKEGERKRQNHAYL